ncbi:MAG: dihydrolipoamide acetyltransferase family protein [Halanaeroarchaeum sp.]
MPRDFELPDVGEGVAEGEIVDWLVEEGDTVDEDQPVAEVETDKAIVEVPSPVDGTVQEIHHDAGTVVEVGDVLVTFAVEGEEEAVEGEAKVETEVDDAEAERKTAIEESDDAAPAETGGETEAPDGATGRSVAPPSVRRLARELGVDVGSVPGSDPGGRVTAGDVRAAAGEPTDEAAESAGVSAAVTSPAEAPPPQPEADRDRTLATPATRRVARELDVDLDAVPAVEDRDGEAFVTSEAVREFAERQRAASSADGRAVAAGEPERHEERVPYSSVRKATGERMVESKYTAPHVTHHDTADVSALVELREELKPRAEERGVGLTYIPFVMKAVVAALEEFPDLNSSLDEEAEEIVRKHYYDIGVAVATDAGLMVPVVENVDRKSVFEIAEEVSALADQARQRTIALEDLRGSTFSITNFGAIGGEYGTPIINYPEVAILGLGAIEERPIVEEGDVVARPTLPLSLSIDHRVIDGAVAAEFTNELIAYLETPSLLFFE